MEENRATVASMSRPEYGEDGVDTSLIFWMLSLTVEQRLEALQQAVRSLWTLKNDNPDS